MLELEANGQILDHEQKWRTTLVGPGDTIYEEGNSLISPDRTKHKEVFLWVNMEIGQSSGNAPLRHFNYE